jgi:hypothetical protein
MGIFFQAAARAAGARRTEAAAAPPRRRNSRRLGLLIGVDPTCAESEVATACARKQGWRFGGFRRRALLTSLLVAGRFPTLAELDDFSHRPSVYKVGYTITVFRVEEWGWDGVRLLVVSRGDIESTLGISTIEFEARWQGFVEQRYL